MPAGVCPETWILEHPDIFKGLQREYVEAGSNIIYAPTFTANRIKLAEYGLEGRIEEINHRLVALSKEAADGKAQDEYLCLRRLPGLSDCVFCSEKRGNKAFAHFFPYAFRAGKEGGKGKALR